MSSTAPSSRTRANMDTLVFRIAGLFVLVSLALSYIHSANWLWFTAFVGANLVQASFTGFCPLAKLLSAMGVAPGITFDAPRTT